MTEVQGRDQAVIMGLFTIHSFFSWDMDNLSLQIKRKAVFNSAFQNN